MLDVFQSQLFSITLATTKPLNAWLSMKSFSYQYHSPTTGGRAASAGTAGRLRSGLLHP